MKMSGTAILKTAVAELRRPAPAPEARAQEPQDSLACRWAGLGSSSEPLLCRLEPSLYGPPALPAEEAPSLARPVLFLHGLTGSPSQFQGMIDWLERGGANRSGGVLKAESLEGLDPRANLFALRFSKPWNPMEVNASEIKDTVEAVCRATGAASVDLVCHSKGGLDARTYLMDPEAKVAHVVTVASPHHGSFAANLELQVTRRLASHLDQALADPDLARTMEELSVDRLDKKGQAANPALHELNASWSLQQERAEFLVFTGSGTATLAGLPNVTWQGDGVVDCRSAALPDVPVRKVGNSDHVGLLRDRAVMLQTAEFLIRD